MFSDVNQLLNAASTRFEHISIAIDESFDISGIAQLTVFNQGL